MNPPIHTPPPQIEIKNLNYIISSKQYFSDSYQNKHILHDINATIKYGRLTAIMGSSGSGKTSLLNILSQRINPGEKYGLNGSSVHRVVGDIEYPLADAVLSKDDKQEFMKRGILDGKNNFESESNDQIIEENKAEQNDQQITQNLPTKLSTRPISTPPLPIPLQFVPSTNHSDELRVGYVKQHDFLFPFHTVREALDMTAKLSLADLTDDEREERIVFVLSKLGLFHCQHTIIGSKAQNIAGISGGEARRVSIGIQLLKDPTVLFCDEITTGLDGSSAFQIMTLLSYRIFE